MAALAQEDDKLQYPMINNVGNEVWKAKEAKSAPPKKPRRWGMRPNGGS